MKIKRYISSIPLRTAEQSWQEIRNLITGADSVDAEQLDDAASVMHSLISDEIFQDSPITMIGVSHRLIIYLRYRQDALEEGQNIDEIQWNPTAGDWTMYVACDEKNIAWVRKTLSERAPRIIVHEKSEKPYDEEQNEKNTKSGNLDINWGVFEG